MPVPLARRLLFTNKLRLAASVVGVAVAVLLVLQNLALYRGIQRYASILVQRAGGDLWVVSPGAPFFELGRPQPESTLYKARSIAGVAHAEPLIYWATGFVCPSGDGGPMNLIGLDPLDSSLLSSIVEGDPRRLAEVGAAVIDKSVLRRCSLTLGSRFRLLGGDGQELHVVGYTEGIRPLHTIPYAFVGKDTVQGYDSGSRSIVTFVSIRVAPGQDVALVKGALARALAPSEVITYDEFLERHDLYWKRTADIRIILLVTSVLALFVGLLVVGQTVYSSTLEHLRQFGTLKAIGASNMFVTAVVLKQAVLASSLGFVGGLGLSVIAGLIVQRFLPSEMTIWQVLFAALVVAGIVAISALAPMRKIVKLEPTEVFR